MSAKETVKRYIVFAIGIFINAFGISFITKASLGTSPISSIPYVLSLIFEPTLGMFTFAFNMLILAGQVAILRKKFRKIQLLQIPVTLIFSASIDLTMYILSPLIPQNYMMKVVFLLIGCTILAFGITLEVFADVVMVPGEAFVRAAAVTLKKEFGPVKICFDTSLMICAAIISLAVFARLNGVREGTVVSALIVGLIVKFLSKRLRFVKKLFVEKAEPESEPVSKPESPFVITISRQYGSGGHEIGKRLASRLGVAFYDKSIVEMTAEDSDYSAEYILKNEQKSNHRFLDNLMDSNYAFLPDELSPREELFVVQSQVIHKIAEKGPGIIVGRCADYVLRDCEHCFNVYLCSGMDARIERIMETEQIGKEEAQNAILKKDRERAQHYKRFTQQVWGDSKNYDLSIDTETFGIEGTVNLIAKAVERIN